MTAKEFPELTPARPVWLITLADLALLLIGFFVLLQANQKLDRRALADGLRAGFGAHVEAAAPVPTQMRAAPLPVAAAVVGGFAAGSSILPEDPARIIAWVRDVARDPRVLITIAGSADGSAADVDPASRSGAVLGNDRARAVAVALATAKAIPLDRIAITNMADAGHGQRSVLVTLSFTAGRQ